MKVLFVSGIIMVNLLISAEYIIDCFWKQMPKIHELMQQILKSYMSVNFKTPNCRSKLFIGVFIFLNCRIRSILF